MKEKWENWNTCVYFGDGGIDVRGAPNAENRARLIASAPALLEALESAIKTAEMENHPLRPWHIKARAAIAAAKGE